MIVKKLIEELQFMPLQAEVKLHHFTGESALFVLKKKDYDGTVWLESESDNDMLAEIGARFDDAIDTDRDETDFYTELMETGIDVAMVRKYMGDGPANRMQCFCEEHGLL